MKTFSVITLISCLISSGYSQHSWAQKNRPNFLFVLVDDQSPFDLKTYDPKSILESPTINRLASEGMVFDGAYHMGAMVGAVCTPSRHT